MTEKQLRDVVVETIQEILLTEITALRRDMRELRRYSRECVEQVRAMRLEFRQNMEQLHRQLERLGKLVEERLSTEDSDKFFSGLNDLASSRSWQASAGSGKPPALDREPSTPEMQARLKQMEQRLGMIEKALQRN